MVFHVKHEGWTVADLSPAQLDKLSSYEGLIRDRAIPLGMVATADGNDLYRRHILDSLRAVPHIPPALRRVCDLGSGAGLPGVPVAIARPDLEVTLAESRRTRVAFLELTVDALGLPNVAVAAGPAEDLNPDFDACLARGFADASNAWAIAEGLLLTGGRLLYWAGASFRREDVPPGVRARFVEEITLESGGPIVIMTSQ